MRSGSLCKPVRAKKEAANSMFGGFLFLSGISMGKLFPAIKMSGTPVHY
jgi:hypothetical protein